MELIAADPVNNKICIKCKKEISKINFYSRNNKLRNCCKECFKTDIRKNREEVLNDPLRRKKFLSCQMISDAKKRAKIKNLKFDLTREWVLENMGDECPVFHEKYTRSKGYFIDFSPSIDRIDNSEGYTKDNCIIVSLLANKIKSSSTTDQLCKVANFYKNLENKNIVKNQKNTPTITHC